MILLDTHAIVWVTEDDPSLGSAARDRIAKAVSAGEALVSAVSFWEVGMLVGKGRMALSLPVPEWAELSVRRAGFSVAPIDVRIAVEAGLLPFGIHGDPGDRFVIATARVTQASIVTADRRILDYAKSGHVEAIDARL